jgi:energy-coupling factor transporter ATP-binding protein EcfA2
MPHSITLSKIRWSTPDGHALLSDLDLTFGAERAGLVGRNGVGKTTLLKLVTGALTPQAGTVAVNGTVGLLRQSVQVNPQETVASLFGIVEALDLLSPARRAGRRTPRPLPMRTGRWRRGLPPRSPASGWRRRRRRRLPPFPVDSARGRRSRPSSSAGPIFSCSTSRRTISTGMGGRRSSICSPAGGRGRSSSATTARCWRPWMPSSS